MAFSSKLDSQAKYLLSTLDAAGEAETPSTIGVLLRGRQSFSPSQLAALEAAGARIRTTAGDVCTADVPVRALERVAELDFVLQIQPSQPLHPERPDQPAESIFDVE
jgi:hypothetical protein